MKKYLPVFLSIISILSPNFIQASEKSYCFEYGFFQTPRGDHRAICDHGTITIYRKNAKGEYLRDELQIENKNFKQFAFNYNGDSFLLVFDTHIEYYYTGCGKTIIQDVKRVKSKYSFGKEKSCNKLGQDQLIHYVAPHPLHNGLAKYYSHNDENKIAIYNKDDEQTHDFSAPFSNSELVTMLFSPCGNFLIVQTRSETENCIYIFNLEKNEHECLSFTKPIKLIGFNPNSSLLAVQHGTNVSMIALENGELRPTKKNISCFAFAPNGQFAAYTTPDDPHIIYVYDRTGEHIASFSSWKKCRFTDLFFSTSGKSLIAITSYHCNKFNQEYFDVHFFDFEKKEQVDISDKISQDSLHLLANPYNAGCLSMMKINFQLMLFLNGPPSSAYKNSDNRLY
ncbi:MAG: WD40 repeat domain-containing protein [Epsilonproteobacteria bacterium]|nr:WD40 repeat domain-containing protein [Campylobacterota bacterium]